MTSMTEQEWAGVLEALCRGGLREYIDSILSAHATRASVRIRPNNLRLMERAWDDGDGNTVHLIAGEEPPWFIGVYEDCDEVCEGLEHDGVLYVAVYQSGGLVSVIVGEGLAENDGGVTFKSMHEAKAYIQGRIAQ